MKVLIIAWLAVAVIFIAAIVLSAVLGFVHIETPSRKAGRLGEEFATGLIREILREGDVLFTNVGVFADGKQTELDNVVVNANGVFIIEVKNLHGTLHGDESAHDWMQVSSSSSGLFYQKTIKNPIKQVKRQIYILAKHLEANGIRLWIGGYVFFVMGNSPVQSSFVLETQADIEAAIHCSRKRKLTRNEREQIIGCLAPPFGTVRRYGTKRTDHSLASLS